MPYKNLLSIPILLLFFSCAVNSQTLQVRQGRSAIIKDAPNGEANEIMRISEGTKVKMLGSVPRYYVVQLNNCQSGYSYKGNFIELTEAPPSCNSTSVIDSATLLARTDVLKIIVIDVEKGDATLIICPEENGQRDILLIDTGESDDGERIRNELIKIGVALTDHPITRFYATHYDGDHIGSIAQIVPLAEVVYDHGNNNIKSYYTSAISSNNVDRRTMTVAYHETFSGGVEVECVAVNNATDVDQTRQPSSSENANSIALIISYDGFDYFTGGDLTDSPEKNLSSGIQDIDVYHVNHHGSSSTSSNDDFLSAIKPEVSVVSNGTQYGHPRATIANKLLTLGSDFYQTNYNPDSLAYHGDLKFVADDTYFDNNEEEDEEGATGNITIIVDGTVDRYFIMIPDLPFSESDYPIEN